MFLGIDWGKFISAEFWLENNPGTLSSRFEVIFLVILVVGYGLFALVKYLEYRMLKGKNRLYARYWRRFSSFLLTMAISFTFIFFFRYEAIPYLGGRYWFLIWTLGGLIWLGLLLWEYYVELPKEVERRAQQKTKSQYLR